jgi:hypothetical protein
MAGYSRLIEANEGGTLSRLEAPRTGVIASKIADRRGRIVNTTGDGLLVEFASGVDAPRCPAEMQTALADGNAGLPPERRIAFPHKHHRPQFEAARAPPVVSNFSFLRNAERRELLLCSLPLAAGSPRRYRRRD